MYLILYVLQLSSVYFPFLYLKNHKLPDHLLVHFGIDHEPPMLLSAYVQHLLPPLSAVSGFPLCYKNQKPDPAKFHTLLSVSSTAALFPGALSHIVLPEFLPAPGLFLF